MGINYLNSIKDTKGMGTFRSTPETNKGVSKGENQSLEYAVSHMCGWRLYMEDAHISDHSFSRHKFALFGVFDGHGGPECAVFVQRHFAQELENNQSFKAGQYQTALKETFMKMDQLLQTEAGSKEVAEIQQEMKNRKNGPENIEKSHAGCTGNVVLITPEYVYCANAGDSRSVALIDGKTVALSNDHKPDDPQQSNRIKNAGGTVSDGRVNGNLNLSRAIGDLQYKGNEKLVPELQVITANPDVTKVKNENIHYIIMGCDGIWEVKTNQVMTRWISKRISDKKPLLEILNELVMELLAKDNGCEYGMDNMSSILVRFKN